MTPAPGLVLTLSMRRCQGERVATSELGVRPDSRVAAGASRTEASASAQVLSFDFGDGATPVAHPNVALPGRDVQAIHHGPGRE
jgi:hypothetical protein